MLMEKSRALGGMRALEDFEMFRARVGARGYLPPRAEWDFRAGALTLGGEDD